MVEIFNKADVEKIEVFGDKKKIEQGLRRRKIYTKTDFPREDVFKESNDFSIKHNTLKSMVLQILRQDKYARKDYFYLCLRVWVLCNHIKLIVPLGDFGKIYKPESITRISRELFAEAKKGNPELKWLLNDKETLNKRENLEELNRGYFQDQKNSEMAKVVKR